MNQLLGRERLERQGLFRPDEVARRIAEHQSGLRRPPQAPLDPPDLPALVRSLAGVGGVPGYRRAIVVDLVARPGAKACLAPILSPAHYSSPINGQIRCSKMYTWSFFMAQLFTSSTHAFNA